MATVLFNGQALILPQVAVAVQTSGLNPATITANRIVMIFGTSVGGEPQTVLTFATPQDASAVLLSGNLLTACLRAWQPSYVVPGASVIQAVRVDPATQASLELYDTTSPTAVNVIDLTSDDYGTYVNNITVTIGPGSISGVMITIQLPLNSYPGQTTAVTEVFDNLASVSAAVAAINSTISGSNLVTATLVATGDNTLAQISATPLAGGTDPAPTNTNWMDAFNLIYTAPADFYVPVSNSTSVVGLLEGVNALLKTQLGVNGFVVFGDDVGLTDDEIIANSLLFNTPDVVHVAPGLQQYNSSGAIYVEPAYIGLAAQTAGILSAILEGYSIVRTQLACVGVERVFTQSELDEFDQNGVLAVGFTRNVGFQYLTHGQTTWTTDTNPANREISVGQIIRDLTNSLITNLNEFIGNPGQPTTLSSVRTVVTSTMQQAQLDGLITPGVDPNTGQSVPAYRNIIINFNSATGALNISVQANPVTPVNYVTVTVALTAVNITG